MGYPPPPPPPGYGPPPGAYAPAPPPAAGSSKGPLIALMAALVVVVLLVVIGGLILVTQGGDDEVELTEAQRTDALIVAGDIGDGFTEFDAEEGPAPAIEASAECDEVLDRLDDEGTNPFGGADDPVGLVERSFSDEGGTTIDIGLAPTVDVVPAYRDLIEACDDLSFDAGDGSTATVTFSEGDEPGIGDDSVRLDADFSVAGPDGQTAEFDASLVAWTRDGTDGLLAFTGGVDPETEMPLSVEDRVIEDVAQRADERLAEVIDEA